MRIIITFFHILAFIGFALILSVCDNHLGKTKVLPIPPTLFSLLFLLSIVSSSLLNSMYNPEMFELLVKVFKKNFIILFPFFLIVFFSLLGGLSTTAYWGSGGIWIFLYAYNFIILILAMLIPTVPFIYKNFNGMVILGLTLAIWAIGSDVVTPGTFSIELNRPAGFSGNSNWGALSIVTLATGALSFNSKRPLYKDFLILCFSGWAVFSTLSRSGSINFAVLSILYLYMTFFTKGGDIRKGLMLLSGIFTAIFILVSFLLLGNEDEEIDVGSQSKSRLSGFLQGEIVDDGSSAARKGAALYALDLMDEAPIFGHGTGFSRTMPEKPHNLFLNQGVNNGMIGLISYLLFLSGMFFHFIKYHYYPGLCLLCVIFIGSFFSHNILEQRTFILILGFMSTAAWLGSERFRYSTG